MFIPQSAHSFRTSQFPKAIITSRPDSRTLTNNTNTTTYYIKQNVKTPLNARLWSTISKSAPSAWGPKRKIQITRGLKRTVLRNVSLFTFPSFEQEFFVFGWGRLWWWRKKEESSKGETPGDGIVHKKKSPILPSTSLFILILSQLQKQEKEKKDEKKGWLTPIVFYLQWQFSISPTAPPNALLRNFSNFWNEFALPRAFSSPPQEFYSTEVWGGLVQHIYQSPMILSTSPGFWDSLVWGNTYKRRKEKKILKKERSGDQ